MVEGIICFDLITDEFKLLNVPDYHDFGREDVHRRLIDVMASLSMICFIENSFRDTEIWVLMNKSSVVQLDYSWTRKFIIKPFSKETFHLKIWKDDKILDFVLQIGALK